MQMTIDTSPIVWYRALFAFFSDSIKVFPDRSYSFRQAPVVEPRYVMVAESPSDAPVLCFVRNRPDFLSSFLARPVQYVRSSSLREARNNIALPLLEASSPYTCPFLDSFFSF